MDLRFFKGQFFERCPARAEVRYRIAVEAKDVQREILDRRKVRDIATVEP